MTRPWHFVVLIVGGVTSGVLGAVMPVTAIAVALAAGAIAVVAPPRVRRGCLFAMLAALSAADGAFARDRSLESPLGEWFSTIDRDGRGDEPALIHGRLIEDAVVTELGVRIVVHVDGVGGRVWTRTSGRVQLHVSGDLGPSRASEWTAGRTILAPAILRRPQTFRNPGSGSEAWQHLRQSVDLIGTIKSAAVVQSARGAIWDEAAAAVRRHVRRTTADVIRSPVPQAIATAILIGDRAGLPDDVQRRLRAAGTYHVIAISGGNVALLTAVCAFGLRLVIRAPRLVPLLTIAAVAAYGWIVGGDASVRRAVLAACLYLGLGLIDIVPAAVNVLGVVAIVLSLLDPLTVVDAGAWLSFGATLSIVLCTGRFMEWATSTPDRASPDATIIRRMWLAVLQLFSATLSAEMFLLPVSAGLFARVSVLGLVLNFVAIPAMAVVQFAALAMTMLSGWWSAGSHGAGAIAEVAARWLVQSASVVDQAPWMVWRVPPVSLAWPALYYGGFLAVIAGRGWRWQRWLGLAAFGCGAAAIVTAPGLAFARPATGVLRVTVLDVGQGDAVLVQFPAGQAMLVDAGGARGAPGFGSRVVTPALWASGVRRLDWLAVTHGDIDHVGGALEIERDLAPREIFEAIPVTNNLELRALRRDAVDTVWRQLLKGHLFDVGSVRVEVLHPPVPDWDRPRVRNDDSLVLRLRYGDVEMLLTGDAGLEFENAFVPDTSSPIRLLKVGHHGSRTSSSRRFLDAFQPQLAFISVGRANLFGHPAPDVLSRYAAIDAEVFRTDLDGAIVIDTDGARVDVHTWTGRRWRIAVKRS